MKKMMIVIALCLVANLSFGYKMGPRSTTDSLVISTWRAKKEALAEEGRVIAVEIQKIESQLVYSKPNRRTRAVLLRQLRVNEAKLRANFQKRIGHLNRGRRLRIPGTRKEPGCPDYAMSSLLNGMKRAR